VRTRILRKRYGVTFSTQAALQVSANQKRDRTLVLGTPYLDLGFGQSTDWPAPGGILLQHASNRLVGSDLQQLLHIKKQLEGLWSLEGAGCWSAKVGGPQVHRSHKQSLHEPGRQTDNGSLADQFSAAAAVGAVGAPSFTVVDFHQAVSLFRLPETVDAEALSFRQVTLVGLSQKLEGSAEGCGSMSDPGVWTMLVWAVSR
jgi:hypothetical protein